MSKIKLEDIFEIETSESESNWFRIKVKPQFKRRLRILTERTLIDIHQCFMGEEDICITPANHNDFPHKFNSIYLEGYEKKNEQGYFGHGEVYIKVKEIKKKKVKA